MILRESTTILTLAQKVWSGSFLFDLPMIRAKSRRKPHVDVRGCR